MAKLKGMIIFLPDAFESPYIFLLILQHLQVNLRLLIPHPKVHFSLQDKHPYNQHRARGMFQFYGANRTGRFSGRNIQLQNLPQNHLSDLAEARSLVRSGNFEAVELLYEDVPDTLSQLIRTAFIPREGTQFLVADFSAIEARVIAWFAGEKWRQEVFAKGGDICCASASQMFKVPVEKHGINGPTRITILEPECKDGHPVPLSARQSANQPQSLPRIYEGC